MPPKGLNQNIPTTTTTLPTGPAPSSANSAGGGVTFTQADLDALLAEAAIGMGGSSAFDSVLAQLGLDPTSQVFMRRMQPEPRLPDVVTPTGNPNRPATTRPGGGARTVFGVDVPQYEDVDSSANASDLLAQFYTLDRDQLLDVQRQLYAGGFMGDIDITDVNWGQHDEDSFAAWATAVGRAARYFAVGEEISVADVLRMAMQERLGSAAAGGGGGGEQRFVQLSDPLALNQLLDSNAQSVLGRKATAGEQRMFVGIVHQLQRSSQLAAQPVSTSGADIDINGDQEFSQDELDAALAESASSGGGVTEVTQPSPEAQAEALLRQQNPTEAGAHDIANQFGNLIQLLNGLV